MLQTRQIGNKINFWEILSYIILGLVISPIIYILLNIFKENSELTEHILDFLLIRYVINTILILVPTVFFTTIIGFLLAYFETFFEYKLRTFFKYMNILSFAIPSYLFGYIYTDIFTSYLYTKFGIYYDIANIKGAIFILTLSFYPYVYIATKSYMRKISMNLIYSSKLLGYSNMKTMWKIIVPISRPAIIAGASLVVMEVLNEFGVPYFFGIQVFSTGIYEAWINYYDLDGAIKLSGILVMFVFLLLSFEYYFRYKVSYSSDKIVPIKREKLTGYKEKMLMGFLVLWFVISFLLPVAYLIRWVKYAYEDTDFTNILNLTKNTLSLLVYAALLIILISIFLTSILRLKKKKKSWIIKHIVSIVYAIPSSIVAIGFLSIFIAIDKLIFKDNLYLIKTPIILIVAYLARFLSLAYNGIEGTINKIGNSYHESSRILGKSHLQTFFKIDLPMLKGAILSALLLVSIEILKEMPIAALLVNKNTLAIQMKNYASDERLAMVSIPALIIISITTIMVIFYNRGEKE